MNWSWFFLERRALKLREPKILKNNIHKESQYSRYLREWYGDVIDEWFTLYCESSTCPKLQQTVSNWSGNPPLCHGAGANSLPRIDRDKINTTNTSQYELANGASASMSYFLFFLFHVNFMKHLCVSHRARSIQEIIQKWSTSEEQQYFLFNPVENSLSSEFLPCLQLTESGV